MTGMPSPNPRWKVRPEGSTWGDFGPDDQVGRLNLVTPERRRAAAQEVREGLAFCLSLPLDLPGKNVLNEHRYPPVRRIEEFAPSQPFVNAPLTSENEHWLDYVCDDAVLLYTQYSTQWDALGHFARPFDGDQDGEAEVAYYNGYRAGQHVLGPGDPGGPGAQALGIENMALTCVQGRGVMVDLFSAFGRERKYVGYDDLMRVMEGDGVVVEEGDMLCLHTGYGQGILDMQGDPDPKVLHGDFAVLNGADEKLLLWIEDSGISLLIADNYAVEGAQMEGPSQHRHDHEMFSAYPIHQKCLVDLGVHLAELWYLTELSSWLKAHKRSRFMLTAPPLRLPGSFGSPVTPVGTV